MCEKAKAIHTVVVIGFSDGSQGICLHVSTWLLPLQCGQDFDCAAGAMYP